jgi:hypothetical protein
MKIYLKKIFLILLSISIVISSAGITIINHICKEENRITSGFTQTDCSETSCEHKDCCCVSTNKNPQPKQPLKNLPNNWLSYKSLDDCCEKTSFSKSVPIISSENSLKKFSEIYKPSFKIEYIQKRISDYILQKVQNIEEKIITPVRKLIKLIRLITTFASNTEFDSLH